MWCARHGHLESGIILAQWSPDTLQKRGTEGLNPAQIAVARGHVKLASELEKIQNNRTPSTEFGGPGGFSGLGCEELSLSMSPHCHTYIPLHLLCVPMMHPYPSSLSLILACLYYIYAHTLILLMYFFFDVSSAFALDGKSEVDTNCSNPYLYSSSLKSPSLSSVFEFHF